MWPPDFGIEVKKGSSSDKKNAIPELNGVGKKRKTKKAKEIFLSWYGFSLWRLEIGLENKKHIKRG